MRDLLIQYNSTHHYCSVHQYGCSLARGHQPGERTAHTEWFDGGTSLEEAAARIMRMFGERWPRFCVRCIRGEGQKSDAA